MTSLEELAPEELVSTLAEKVGFYKNYYSFFGEQIHANALTQGKLLSAMGYSLEQAKITAAIDDIEHQSWQSILPSIHLTSVKNLELGHRYQHQEYGQQPNRDNDENTLNISLPTDTQCTIHWKIITENHDVKSGTFNT